MVNKTQRVYKGRCKVCGLNFYGPSMCPGTLYEHRDIKKRQAAKTIK